METCRQLSRITRGEPVWAEYKPSPRAVCAFTFVGVYTSRNCWDGTRKKGVCRQLRGHGGCTMLFSSCTPPSFGLR